MRRYVALISYFAPVFLLLHLIALWCLRNRNSHIFRFALFSLLAIGCNLIVYATLSTPVVTRYYDRLGWLSALVAALWASSELDKRRRWLGVGPSGVLDTPEDRCKKAQNSRLKAHFSVRKMRQF